MDLDDEVSAVVRAWTDPGPQPGYHRQWMERVRTEWPTLGSALDRLAHALTETAGYGRD